jgi:hypothetical protein
LSPVVQFLPGHQGIRASGYQGIRASGHQGIRASGHQGYQERRTMKNDDVKGRGRKLNEEL